MARAKKNKDTTIVCYKYWIKPVSKELPKEVFDEAYKMNALWNRFVELDKQNYELYQAVLTDTEEIADIKKQYDAKLSEVKDAHEEIKKARIRLRSKNDPLLETYKSIYKQKKQELQDIKEKMKELKAETKKLKTAELEAVKEEFNQKVDEIWKHAYHNEMYWANASAVKEDFLKARERGLKTGDRPKFHKFNGEMRFAYQFPGGKDTKSLFTTKDSIKIIRIEPFKPVEITDGLSKRQIEKMQKRTILHAYIGGVTVPFHINIHRPIPEGLLKTATIKSIKQGTHREWSISLTIEQPPKTHKEFGNPKACALDVGYRMIDDKIRIAMLVSDTEKREIYLPDKILNTMRYADKLNSNKALLFETVKKETANKLPSDAPAELKANWTQARELRLVKIMNYLKETGHFYYEDLQKWYQQDRRIFNEICGLKARAIRYRRDYYYNVANAICDKYDKIIIEDLDLAEMQKLEKPDGSSNELRDEARYHRTISAIGEFLQILRYVAQKKGKEAIKVEAAYTTMRCHVCGEIVKVNDRSKLIWVCNNCMSKWDQDYNAAVNLLKSIEKTA